ncbi:phosphatidylglycerol--prolipoprotein diacylglyceryl transferase [Demequina sediminis]|uniref:Phosphatidylglycerol--prolipoprotein diacylglyceryl transferase n=1 Tax=Demequina sediminis TaxID=1930058 RepID=A0ABP9WJL2_9MICO|nr:prolipoprotein diacylglyceryl transferase [Demequina sediminis]BDZ61178.1 prolipoprotein diacylglyceryl transferase 2 [Demequina sediminis]
MTTSIPSPPVEWSAISIGPLTIHAYALWILLGIFVALWLTTRRWVERGGDAEVVSDIAFWAIPFGIVGGRIYHVVSSPGAYFGEGGNPWAALRIWEGGLGIWGAVALGALGAWIGARRAGASFTAFIDAAAPGVLIAQAIGRMGNYFNQELFGGATTLPWGLEIDPAFRPEGYEQFATFHPTFLYELLWNLAGAALIIYLDRRLDLRGGRVFWLYVIVYVSGRLWIEGVRIDEAVTIAGLRINEWVSIVVLSGAVAAFTILGVRQRAAAERPPRSQLAAQASHPEDEPETDADTVSDAADTPGDHPTGA